MNELEVGRIKNFCFNTDTNDLEITLIITDNKFKKKIIRDFSMIGKLKIDGEIVTYSANTMGNNDG
tara:strand:+ start:151 stop:348 length:198 start_codon:yes stop_codon:yes gene_type:complete